MLEGLELWSDQVGVPVSQSEGDRLRAFWRLVLETNKHTNLTRITDDQDAVLKHFVDSLAVLNTGVVSTGARLVDIGTGAGFPGIPLKIVRPDVRLTLVDSTLKRVRFLQHVIESLTLTNVKAVHGRAEQLGQNRTYAGRFDVAIARALARWERLVGLCMPFVEVGGHFIAMKGPEVDEELREGESALRQAGGEIVDVHRFPLPEGAGERTLIVAAKIRRGA